MKYIINILILLALVALVVLKLKENKSVVEDRVFHYDSEKPIHVLTKKLSLEGENAANQVTGNFLPNRNTQVNSEMQGKILSIKVNEGDRVRKGQVLAQLDASLLKLQMQALDVKIEGFNTDIQRYKILVEADAIQAVKLEKTELGLKAAQAQRATMEEQIKKTTVYAPFSGVIVKKMAEVGSFAAPARPLFILTDINRLKFTVNVPENQLGQFKLHRSYPITVDAFPGIKLKGKVVTIASQGNMGNSFPVELEVKNLAGQKIKAGMFGKLNLKESKGEKRIIIAASSIIGSVVKPQVYKVQGGKVMHHEVVIAKRFGDKVVIGSGLQEGDEIVTSGFINLFEGANITTNKAR